MNTRRNLLVAGMLVLAAAPAFADAFTLNFENITTYPNNSNLDPVGVENYYNGGTSSTGTSGPNYGVYFSSNALVICLNTVGVICSQASRGGQGDPNSQEFGLNSLTGNQIILDDPAGFTDGIALFESSPGQNPGAGVSVYSGLDGTGTLLATIPFVPTPWDDCSSVYDAGYCPLVPIGTSFTGTAESVVLTGSADTIVYDDITLGSATPGNPAPTPEPCSLAMLLTAAVAGSACLRKKLRL